MRLVSNQTEKNIIDDYRYLLSIAHFIKLHQMTFTKVLATLVPSSNLFKRKILGHHIKYHKYITFYLRI
jgi:hypothetical protein